MSAKSGFLKSHNIEIRWDVPVGVPLDLFTPTGMSCIGTRWDVPVGVPLDLFTPTGMSCIGTYGENCKSDNV